MTGKFGCEKCLYEGTLQNAKFISLKARETVDTFSQNYTQFSEILKQLNMVEPEFVTQSIRTRVALYFSRLKEVLDGVEASVMDQIKRSKNLKDYLRVVDFMQRDITQEMLEVVEKEKRKLDSKMEND